MIAAIAVFTHLSPNVVWVLASMFGFLALATIIVYAIPRLRISTELVLRIRTWWMIIGLVAVVLALGKNVSIAFCGFVSFLAFKEYLSLIPGRRSDRRVLFWAYLAIPLQYLWIAMGWYGMFIIFVPVWCFLILPMRMVMAGETQGFLRAAGTLHWGLMTTVYFVGHLAYMLALPSEGNPVAGGVGFLLYAMLLTQGSDVFQYIFGKLFGRHKIVPTVSPGKTWEGFIGGMATTVVLAWALSGILTPFSSGMALAAGLLVGVAGFMGDVVESAFKRDLGVKDSGSILPGHGGILDRIDSLTFAGPTFFHFVNFFYYGTWLLAAQILERAQ